MVSAHCAAMPSGVVASINSMGPSLDASNKPLPVLRYSVVKTVHDRARNLATFVIQFGNEVGEYPLPCEPRNILHRYQIGLCFFHQSAEMLEKIHLSSEGPDLPCGKSRKADTVHTRQAE